MGALIRATDWAATPLGHIDTWSPSLRMMVSMLLANRFPLLLWWGPHYISIYNDAYRPILGTKHPWALGRPVSECWSEIWHVLQPLIDTPFHGGPATWMEDIPLEINRHGFVEETHFTIAYSPVPDATAPRGIGGVLATVHEITEKVVAERRAAALSDLGLQIAEGKTAEAACAIAAASLANHARDVPFALLYLRDADGRQARLAGAAGIGIDEPASLPVVDLVRSTDFDTGWPLAEAVRSESMVTVGNLASRFASLPSGPWSDAPNDAVIVPIRSSRAHELAGLLVAGVSPRLRLDDLYRSFFDLVATQIATAVVNARAYEEERRRAEALAEIDRAKTAFFSNVSHEFRTPLTLMLAPLEDLLKESSGDALSASQREQLEIAHRNSLRLLRLVNTLLDFSRIEAGRAQASYQPSDLATLTADLAAGFRSAVERAGLFLEIDCKPLDEPVCVDREMWETIVLNLLSNAFKFTFDGGITVRVERQGDRAVLTVGDTGVGIPDHDLPRVFERFHRIEGQRSRSFEGSGIGLALVQELVRAHGGTIKGESEPGRGTAFTVVIPFGTAHLPPEQIGAARPTAPGATRIAAFLGDALRWLPEMDASVDAVTAAPARVGATEPRPTVLLADDNIDMRHYMRRLLDARYDVTAVADGQEALDSIRRTRPDLVLADVMMPRLDGFGLLRAIRADPALRELPVVLVSARAGEEARANGLDAGADDYLIKPFSARELLARLAATLALAQVRQAAAQAAMDSAERLRQLFEQAPGFMCVLRGPDHVFELANAAYLRLVGGRDIIDRPVRDVFPEVEPTYFDLLDDAYCTGRAFTGRGIALTLRRADTGAVEEKFVDLVYQPIRGPSGVTTGIFVEGADVTDRVRAEMALRDANERLEARVAERTTELREALDQLHREAREREQAEDALRQAQKMEAIGQLTGGIAHDFNNLLTGISASLELTQARVAQGRTTELDRYLTVAMSSVTRASALTHRLLAFARRQPLDARPTDVNRLVASMEDLIRRTVGPAIRVETRLAAGLSSTLCDAGQLETALLNMCINARDAMPDGGHLTIETADVCLDQAYAMTQSDLRPGPYVSLSVADTGVGMPPDVVAHAFEPFFTTKPLGQGTGLGLSMLYGFVRQSDGHVQIDSEPGQGTTVRLYLPRHRGEIVTTDSIPAIPTIPGGARERDGAGATVLVVEDEAVVRALTVELLAELGYTVIGAADGPGALHVIASDAQVDLLVTDVGLPGMNGRQLADAARERRPGLKVLFVTGYAHKAAVGGGALEAGMEMIAKPFELDALAAMVGSMIHGGPAGRLRSPRAPVEFPVERG